MSTHIRTPEEYVEGWGEAVIDHEIIGRMIAKHSPGGAVLDLGCGPMLPIWAQFHPKVTRLVGVDRFDANIKFVEKVMGGGRFPATFQAWRDLAAAINPNGPSESDIRAAFDAILDADVVEDRPSFHQQFDVITQIGCFACLPTDGEVKVALSHLADYMKPSGVFISVMWNAAPGFIEDPVWGGDERTSHGRKIDYEGMKDFMEGFSLKLIEENFVSPCDEPERYQSFYIAAFKFTPARYRHFDR